MSSFSILRNILFNIMKEQFKPTAKIILDSISPDGIRLTTMEVVMHRFVLAEVNTHRNLSRNSASSRAIPIEKMIQRVQDNPAIPLFWGKKQAGMQAFSELEGDDLNHIKELWNEHKNISIEIVKQLDDLKLHKQIANRALETHMNHTAVITSTYWNNFFAQRRDKDAQPEIKALADEMYIALNQSTPKQLNYGEWHMPYLLEEDYTIQDLEILKKVSVARCARTSYLSQYGKREIEKDIELYDRLVEGMHPSPFEHVASPCHHMELLSNLKCDEDLNSEIEIRCKRWGNFYGWHQLRKYLENENRN